MGEIIKAKAESENEMKDLLAQLHDAKTAVDAQRKQLDVQEELHKAAKDGVAKIQQDLTKRTEAIAAAQTVVSGTSSKLEDASKANNAASTAADAAEGKSKQLADAKIDAEAATKTAEAVNAK